MKYIVLIIMNLVFSTVMFAQNNLNITEREEIQQDIISLEKRINELVKKDPKLKNIQGIKQFHVLLLGYKNDITKKDINKEKYKDYSFLDLLVPRYNYYTTSNGLLFRKKKKYITTLTLITDSEGNLIAYGDGKFIVSNFNPKLYFDLTKTLFSKKLDTVIYLEGPHNSKYSIGIKGNELYALENDIDDLKIYPWKDFMNCCFESWFRF
ncbi:hypothetical protein EDL98_09090 [Ornithobacterium rhinotracheale]|uniref:hypothetical protein n=1 Tax=Ornithobacterium rhinotracheale TaxID=28251 RepID=UPI00129C2463|nr:hypothetical protein [Ornithobacterium rhinotracheale]MRJ11227.1 hypothetical protein [Ornithobacterium rhinotracheale]